jgi:hypothetical protein
VLLALAREPGHDPRGAGRRRAVVISGRHR